MLVPLNPRKKVNFKNVCLKTAYTSTKTMFKLKFDSKYAAMV